MFFIVLLLILLVVALSLWSLLNIDSFETLKRIVNAVLNNNEQHIISNLFQVDESSKRHGGELVAAVLKSHNVQEIFVLCGGHISPILVAAEQLGIRIIDTRNEATAVFAADAVARLRQSIGVAAVTAGPGVTNTITAIKNAQMAETPLLLLGGAAPTLLKGRGALQDIDQLTLFRTLCKFSARVTRLRDIVPTLRTAISTAQSGTPGPVFVELPVDVLYAYDLVIKDLGYVKDPKGFRQKAVNQYLLMHISRQFGGAWLNQDLSPIPFSIPLAKEEDIAKVAQMIAEAHKPLLLLGSQAVLQPVKAEELRVIVEKLRIPTYLAGMSRGLLGTNSQWQLRQNRKEALKEADVIILAGAVCDFRLSYGRVLSSRAKIVSINRGRQQLSKNEGIFWKASALLQADVASTLSSIGQRLELLGFEGSPSTWIASLTEREKAKEVENQKKITEKFGEKFLNPLKVLTAIDKVLPDDAILVADGGDFVGSAAYIVRPRGPLQWLDPGAFGTLGVGGGFALGAKTAFPNRPVFILYGDGACGYSVMEFDTFTRHKMPVVAFIGNDACWSQIAREQIPIFNTDVGVNLSYTRYEAIANAFGARGEMLSGSDDSSLEDRLRDVVTATQNGESVIVNFLIGKSNFRQGSISV